MAGDQAGSATDTGSPAPSARAKLGASVESRAASIVESAEEKDVTERAAAAEEAQQEKAEKREKKNLERGKNRAKERITALTSKVKELEARVAAGGSDGAAAERSFIEKIKKNPALLFDKTIGLELREISKAYLESVDPETREQLERDGRLKALEDKATAAERRAVEAEMTAATRAALDDIRAIVNKDPTRWELVLKDKAGALKILRRAQVRINKLRADGERVDEKRAIAIVQKCADKQEKKFEELGSRYRKSSSSASDKSPTENQGDARSQRVGPKTITSSIRGAGGGAQPQRDDDKLSPRERLQRRIASRRASA